MSPTGAPRRPRRAPQANADTRRTAAATTNTTQGRFAAHPSRTPEMDSSIVEGPESANAMPPLNFQNRLLRPPRMGRTPRLSMPEVTDDESDSELEASYLAQPRQQRRNQTDEAEFERGEASGDDTGGFTQPGNQDMSVEEMADDVTQGDEEEYEEEEDGEMYEGDPDEVYDQADHDGTDDDDMEQVFPDGASLGLKEISNLGKFMVSSHKPGNGVEELRIDDVKQFWQSDGPQPHRLTVYFVKRVGIRSIQFYVNHVDDESYTPTKIVFKSGTSENNLITFATMDLKEPKGWQVVPLQGAGGDPDGNTLVSYVLQMQILENHQNGKDTHLRGIKIFAFDTDSPQGVAAAAAAASESTTGKQKQAVEKEEETEEDSVDADAQMTALQKELARLESGAEGLTIPDYMREPELR